MITKDLDEKPATMGQFNNFQEDTENNFKEIKNTVKVHYNGFRELRSEFKGFRKETNQTFKETRKILIQHTSSLLNIENTMKLYGGYVPDKQR